MSTLWSTHGVTLAGAWKCTSFTLLHKETATLLGKPHGDNPLGRVLISASGYFSAHVADPSRMQSLPSKKPWREGNDDELAFVARGLSMYCGYLRLFEDEGGLYWQTRVEVSSDPAWIGGIEERRVEYFEEGGKVFMRLEPKDDIVLPDGTRARGVLMWEKFESA